MALLWWGWSEPERIRAPRRAPSASPLAKAGAMRMKRRSWWWIALAGACAGLLPYTYIPARFTPFLFLFLGLSFLLTWGGQGDRGKEAERRPRFPRLSFLAFRVRAELPRAAIFVGVTGLVAAPILIHFALHPEHFLMRSKEVWFLRGDQISPLAAFLGNVWEHLLAFGLRGDPDWRHNFAGQSMLNPMGSALFLAGRGVGCVALATARVSSAAALAGRTDSACHALHG